MKVCVLASGSKGNSTYISTLNNKILIDIGMTNSYIESRLLEMDVNADEIDSIFITHTHIDHISGLKVFIKKHNPTIYLTQKMYDELKETIEFKKYQIIDDKIVLNDLIIESFKTSHDTNDSLGYIISNSNKSIVYVTDTGYINIKNLNKMSNKNIYIFESNHDVEKLMKNERYPYHTKQRILGDKGHLSNVQSAEYLKKIVGKNTKNIILAHLSEQNNEPSLALEVIKKSIDNDIEITIANQNEKTEVIEV